MNDYGISQTFSDIGGGGTIELAGELEDGTYDLPVFDDEGEFYRESHRWAEEIGRDRFFYRVEKDLDDEERTDLLRGRAGASME